MLDEDVDPGLQQFQSRRRLGDLVVIPLDSGNRTIDFLELHFPARQSAHRHALICFLALVLYRVMRMRLKASGSSASPKTALEMLRRIQKHRATIGERTYTGISKTTPEQLDLFAVMSLPKP